MRYCLTLILFLVIHSITAQHTIPVLEGDTVLLNIDNCRGDLQWQISEDEVSWTDIDDETTGTLKYVPVTFPAWFRLKITEGDCDPHYSEVVKVIVPSLPTVTTATPDKMRKHNAVVGGGVTDDGGAPIIERGVVYGTSGNPTLENALFTTEGTGTGSFVSHLFALTPGTSYFVRAYATNMKGTAYGTELGFFTVDAEYHVGETGPAGGIVFYKKSNEDDGWRYLEAAPKHWSGSDDPWFNIDWGCNETFVGGTSTAVGTGKENTDILIAEDCIGPQSPASIANDAVINGFDDWFLPSRDELQILFDKLFQLNSNFRYIYGFNNISYSSSSEIDATSVWGVGFGGGTEQQNSKTVDSAIRPVRRF